MSKLPKKTSLTSGEEFELHEWLQENEINPAKLRRRFADVLPVARLLSRYYPKLVDVNYYPPKNSVQNKLYNWEFFNQRVLSRLGMRVKREEMEQVARCVPGAVDLLLYEIWIAHQVNQYVRLRAGKDTSVGPIKSACVSPIHSGVSNVKPRKAAAVTGGMGKQRATSMLARKRSMVQGEDFFVVNVRKQIGDLVYEEPEKLVLYSVYEQVADSLERKSLKVACCEQRNDRLNSMLQQIADIIRELHHSINLLQIQTRLRKCPSAQNCRMSGAKQPAVSSSVTSQTTSFTSFQSGCW